MTCGAEFAAIWETSLEQLLPFRGVSPHCGAPKTET